jgi:hypothetical protein
MGKRLQVTLPDNWVDHSADNPDGPPTFMRVGSERNSALQVSYAWYKGGKEPRPTDANLISLSSRAFEKVAGYKLISTDSGGCTIGRFGTAVGRCDQFARLQAWHLSDGLNFVMVTHICEADPTEAEVAEAQQIVEQLVIADEP